MRNDHTTKVWFRNKKEKLLVGVCRISFKVAAEMVVVHRDFAIAVLLLCNLVVEPSFSQTTGVDVEPVEYEAGGNLSISFRMTTTTDYGLYGSHSNGNGPEAPTTVVVTTVGGEVEVEFEGVVSTTTAKPLPKPKKKTTTQVVKTTTSRATVKPLASPATATATNASTTSNAGQESTVAPSNYSKAVTNQGETSSTTKAPDRLLTTQPITTTLTTTTTPRPMVKMTSRTHDLSIRNMLTSGHTCPKMEVATWENEVVIYDNNCAIIIRMNPQLRRPTVTFQAPYW
ncbi:hypothetical protein CHS0354_042316 [Potamilus streckersoni]|uniref:Uncharacterized protein n=1 Tax=Potamilus streckersoni TaxID=2493646 RepID=A0AAE0STS4_9BIVA|nr:hypothetical protein CHS0354_042316 [Potamilus streckersoni]